MKNLFERIFFPKRYVARSVLQTIENMRGAYEKGVINGNRIPVELYTAEKIQNEVFHRLKKYL